MLMLSQRKTIQWLMSAGRSAVGGVIVILAVANVLTAVVANPWAQAVFVQHLVDLRGFGWGRAGVLAVGLSLAVVGRALARGKRHAWLLAVGLLGFSVSSSVASRGHHGYISVALGLLVALLFLAPLFSRRSDPRALWRGYIALALSVYCLMTLGTIAHLWRPGEVAPFETLELISRRQVLFFVRMLLFLFLGFGVVEVLRPVLHCGRLYREEQARAVRVVRRHGQLATVHFTLMDDKRYYWSASGRAMIAYRLTRGVALVLGDPIGPEEEQSSVLLAFIAYCRRQDWMIALYQTGPRTRQVARLAGLHAYKIGEEAVVDAGRFTTQGKVGAPVRHAMARARRDGLMVRCWQGEAPPEDIFAGMLHISQAWLGEHHTHTQMRFSMGSFPSDWSPELLTAVALDAGGTVRAFLTWTPLYAGNGWALDNMRRVKETAPGTMELLIAESLEWARVRGYARMSLGLAPLAGLAAEGELPALDEEGSAPRRASLLERSASYLHKHKLLLGNYSSLYFFKGKFQPVWEPRYLIVNDRRALPQVLAALMRAQGYTWWRVVRDARRQRVG